MNYNIIIERAARKNLEKIHHTSFEIINKEILSLETDPRPHGCKKLKGRDAWRIRVGDYRIIYKIKDNILQIIVIEIDH